LKYFQQSLFNDLDEKIKASIECLKAYEPPGGYVLGFSGGKDSQVLYWLAQKAGVEFKAVYLVTTVDPPELIYFIRKHYPKVIFNHPKETMWSLIERKKTPPTRRFRYCCDVLKERSFENEKVLIGVRKAESPKRTRWATVTPCLKGGGYTIISPMLQLSDNDIWNIINDVAKMPYCSLYDEGFKRIGCIACPMAYYKQREFELKKYPKFKDLYIKTFKKVIERRKETDMKYLWSNETELFEWWMYGAETKKNIIDENQLHLFEL